MLLLQGLQMDEWDDIEEIWISEGRKEGLVAGGVDSFVLGQEMGIELGKV